MSKSSFSFDTPEESPGFLLWQVSISWQREIKTALEPYKISHAQFVILAVLLWCEESKTSPIQSFLVDKTKLDKMTVSASLKKLALQNFIKRNESSKDTRAKSVLLTNKGTELTKQLVKLVEGVDKKFFGNIELANQQAFVNTLNTLAGKDRDTYYL